MDKIKKKILLLQKRKELKMKANLIKNMYTPAIFQNIKDLRDTIRNLCIVSGAIAALSINLLDTEAVLHKPLAIISSAFFLLVVWIGFVYLKTILERENHSVVKIPEKIIKAIAKVVKQIDKVSINYLESEERKIYDYEKELEIIQSQKEPQVGNWFTKNIGDVMLIPFTTACFLTIASFVKLNYVNIGIFILLYILTTIFIVRLSPKIKKEDSR